MNTANRQKEQKTTWTGVYGNVGRRKLQNNKQTTKTKRLTSRPWTFAINTCEPTTNKKEHTNFRPKPWLYLSWQIWLVTGVCFSSIFLEKNEKKIYKARYPYTECRNRRMAMSWCDSCWLLKGKCEEVQEQQHLNHTSKGAVCALTLEVLLQPGTQHSSQAEGPLETQITSGEIYEPLKKM